MGRKVKNPMPKVEWEGKEYSLISRKTAVPNLYEMHPIEARIWINRNTRGRGYFKPANPMTGYAGIITND